MKLSLVKLPYRNLCQRLLRSKSISVSSESLKKRKPGSWGLVMFRLATTQNAMASVALRIMLPEHRAYLCCLQEKHISLKIDFLPKAPFELATRILPNKD